MTTRVARSSAGRLSSLSRTRSMAAGVFTGASFYLERLKRCSTCSHSLLGWYTSKSTHITSMGMDLNDENSEWGSNTAMSYFGCLKAVAQHHLPGAPRQSARILRMPRLWKSSHPRRRLVCDTRPELAQEQSHIVQSVLTRLVTRFPIGFNCEAEAASISNIGRFRKPYSFN